MSDILKDTCHDDFDFETLPWLDHGRAEIDRYVAKLDATVAKKAELRAHLVHWMQFGFTVLERAIEPALIDAFLQDVDDLLADHRKHNVFVDCDVAHVVPIKTIEDRYIQELREDRGTVHLRINDLHNYSTAAKKLSLHKTIVEVLGHILRGPVVAIQSLTFFKGSEQEIHQDYAFVRAKVPSQLAATWIALEDIHPDAGPLMYIPGSHSLPKFEWGDGIFRTQHSTRNESQFASYIHAVAEIYREQVVRFAPRKGDVFIWHGALAHGGSPAVNRNLTRKSYVSHYSNADHHDFDYRAPDRPTERIQINGGYIHRSPIDPRNEDILRNGGPL